MPRPTSSETDLLPAGGLAPWRERRSGALCVWLVLYWLTCAPLGATAAGAADASRTGAATGGPSLPIIAPAELGYSVTHLTVEDGLPERIITSLAQTPDGYLWCGSPSGLARYDGASFTVFSPNSVPALKGVQVLELRCDADGRLWIAGLRGQLVVYEHGQFRRLSEADGISPDQAYSLNGVCEEGLWLKSRSGNSFYRYHDGRFEAVTFPGIPSSSIKSFEADAAGMRWGVQSQPQAMVHFTSAGSEVHPLVAADGKSPVGAGRLFTLQDGTLAVTSSHGIYALNGAQWTLRRGFSTPINSRGILDGVEDWHSNFWVSVFVKGLVVSTPDGRTAWLALPDSNDRVHIRALLCGAEGNIWAAGDEGVYRLRRNTFRTQPTRLGETRNKPAKTCLQVPKGRTWIFYPSGWARQTETGWKYTAHPHPGAFLWTAAMSSDGSVILGYSIRPQLGQPFVEELLPTGQTKRLGSLEGNPRIIFESREGKLWVGTDAGLWRRDGGQFARVRLPHTSDSYPVHALAEDREGRIFAGAYHYGLYRLDGTNGWQRLTTATDVGSEGIWAIHLDDESTLWMATDSGLARWRNGRWHSYAGARSALPKLARSVICDNRGAVWLAGQFGVTRVERRKLDALAAGEDVTLGSDWFDRSDGLPSIYCAEEQDALRESSDDRIWVATAGGAAVLDLEEWRHRREQLDPPSVHIQAVLVDDNSPFAPGTPSEGAETPPFVVPPGAHRLEFRYTAINLTAGRKSRFRYRLEGADKKWLDAAEQRAAVYHHLPPGDYRFQVTAANKYGLWNNKGASVAFTVRPFWWQALWARLGLGGLVLGLLWGSRSIKLRQLRRRRAHQEEFARRLIESQEAERKRIASELHDSLGQNLLIAKNQLFLAQEMTNHQDGRIQPKLQQVADSVGAALEEARAISHQLRPFQLERLGLTAALRAMVKQTSDSTKIPIKTQIESVDGLLPADGEVMIYRILQEALSNVVKHADASEVQIVAARNGHHLRMIVQDDGRGFDAERVLNGGNGARGLGLTSFEERTRLLGGHFHCRSSPGDGTTLIFEFPIPQRTPNEGKD